MRHRKRRGKLGIKSAHRKALLRNLVKSLVERKRIRTTIAKAKEASSFADQMITLAKRGGLHAHRQLISELGCAQTAQSLVRDIAPHFKARNGGYTRVLRLGYRAGDAAQTALLEFTETIETVKKPVKPKKEKKAKPVQTDKAAEATATDSGKEKKTTSSKDKDRKESEKRGGFLGTLRKFLKGDDK